MLYTSTRDNTLRVTAAQAITNGISPDGGLYLPTEVPQVSPDFIASLAGMPYRERAKKILALYLSEFPAEELSGYIDAAYGGGKFSSPDVAPLINLHDNVNILELWHGPTCAFKDMALQLLPHLLTGSAKRVLKDKEIVILVATSGDTGKAALEGFRDVAGSKIFVFFPNKGVSPMQQRQMQTQEGANVGVCAINGNFDDAQTGVKAIFTDAETKRVFERNSLVFSSANSINWGRLAPQIVYYFSAYADLIRQGRIKNGEEINIVVPTGNFGNILAAEYAGRMGLPVKKLVCASNKNNILTDFINTGRYDKNRDFYTTISPSMDILISSNLERLIFSLSGDDSDAVRALYSGLAGAGEFTVPADVAERIRTEFAGGCCDDAATKKTIHDIYAEYDYLVDTHTAVALRVCEDYLKDTGDDAQTVVASTASPFKFCAAVLSALKGEGNTSGTDFEMLRELETITGLRAPAALASLEDKPVRFSAVCDRDVVSMRKAVFDSFGIA